MSAEATWRRKIESRREESRYVTIDTVALLWGDVLGLVDLLCIMASQVGDSADHLYVIADDLAECVKVGRSADPEARLKQLQTGNPSPLRLERIFRGWGDKEPLLHSLLTDRVSGEWFRRTEAIDDWLSLDERSLTEGLE